MIRTRIPPSPTGYLHMGNARTALFNYLFTKKNNGRLILRIEDTDRERSTEEFEKDIIDELKWLQITWNEGPYRQSERLKIYGKYLDKLIEENKAYYCFCTEEELEAERQYQMSQGLAPKYSGKCSSITREDAEKRLKKEKAVVRFRNNEKKVEFDDLIRGHIEFNTELTGDFVIAKDLNTPLYNFAVVIDDYEMKITHVIRGEDHLSNTPKQILMQKALGFETPFYGHLPLILGSDRSKLSKRHGAASVKHFREQGYLKESLINFLAFLGWNPGTDKEIYSIESLINDFSLEKVQKGGAVFNIEKLNSLNSYYIKNKDIKELTELCIPYLVKSNLIEEKWGRHKAKETGEGIDMKTLMKIVSLYKERMKKLSDISELTDYFFKNLKYDKEMLKWKEMDDREVLQSLSHSEKILKEIPDKDFTEENLMKILTSGAEMFAKSFTSSQDRGYLLWPLRVALTAKKASASPFEVMFVLGKEKTLERLNNAKKIF